VREHRVRTPREHRPARESAAQSAREVVLFTDLANATSNAPVLAAGYRPIANRVVLAFAADG
jgi:hypothetical protein